MNLSDEELNQARQWFNAVQDLNHGYLEQADYALANKIHKALNMRTPNSITSQLSNITAAIDLQPSNCRL